MLRFNTSGFSFLMYSEAIMIFIYIKEKTYTLVNEMIKIRKFNSWFVKENSFINGIILVLFLFKTIINVNSSDFRISVNLRTWSFLWVLVGRGLIRILIMRLVKISKTWWLVIILMNFFLVMIFIDSAHSLNFICLNLYLIIN